MFNDVIIISFKQTSKVTEISDGGPMYVYINKVHTYNIITHFMQQFGAPKMND